ncbi:MAG TPA: alkaline phosphatase family protein [Acidimicrobiales bacterium]|nr:alkaline phosphatase family protein [Acidimicrobiales bacterium]
MNRRRFLGGLGATGGALLGGSALLGACSGSSPKGGAATTTTLRSARTTPTALLDIPAASSPVSHIVVLMQENRSFDHWLGWLADDEAYLEAGRRRYGTHFTIAGDQRQRFAGANGDIATMHLPGASDETNPFRGCGHPDPGHSWSDGRAQRDDGFLAKASGNDDFALGYYRAADLPFTSKLASRFSVCDHSHASLLSSTFPNRMYLHSAQSGGQKDNSLPTDGGFGWDTIWDRLDAAQVDAAYYYSDLPVTFLWGDRLQSITHKVDEYFDACEKGTLPSVTFIDPGFIGATRTDNHPFGDIHAGERFARDVFAAFARSPHWKNGVFIHTYDEWGGFFDHVKPPVLADARASRNDAENFAQAGFRIPTVVASPYARPGSVDHTLYDHTSILRMIEWRFLGAPATGTGGAKGWSLTSRDRHANNIASTLTESPMRDLDFELDVTIPQPTPACEGQSEGLIAFSPPDEHATRPQVVPTSGGQGDSLEKTFMEQLHAAGYFERIGVDVRPCSMADRWVASHAT